MHASTSARNKILNCEEQKQKTYMLLLLACSLKRKNFFNLRHWKICSEQHEMKTKRKNDLGSSSYSMIISTLLAP
jgi:hypothetical protein